MSIKELCSHCGGTGESNCVIRQSMGIAEDSICPLCKGIGWLDLPDWVRTKSEAVQAAQLQRHEREQEMSRLQQVGTILEIIEGGYA